jgi:hypothetical protein
MLNRYFIYFIFLSAPFFAQAQDDLFYGSFNSWTNLKQAYHAFGDGTHDDTHALQAALDDLGSQGHSPILFIPAGTYRITATLHMKTRKGIGIIGETPETTIVKWDGAAGARMFSLNGVSYSEYSRMTWDGNDKALAAYAHEWDGSTPYANSGTQHSDEIFKNIGVGLLSGPNMDAEFTIRRCRFYNCTSAGISLQGFNALDWWVWDCYFENCRSGVSNALPKNGGGNFHVYRCKFIKSISADILINNAEFFSFRDNISYNSNFFILVSQFANSSPITVQGNLVINNRDVTSAYLFTKGNVLFLDNSFLTTDSGKNYIVDVSDNYGTPPPDLSIIGNSFNAKQKNYRNSGTRTISFENKSSQNINAKYNLDPKPFALPANYPVIEVNNKMSADEIQSAIDKAVSAKKKTIVHFSYGNYNIAKTLQIPSNAGIILMGDGLSSVLNWSGNNTGAIIEMGSPAKAVVQNLYFNGNTKADCLLIHDNDQDGNSIYGDQVLLYHGVQTNLFVDGISRTDIRFDDFQHNYCNTGTSIKLVGTNDKNPSLLKIFGGESSNFGNSYDVAKGARILLFDVWYENSNNSRFLTLRDKGEFVLNGGKIANTNVLPTQAFIDIDSFSGKITLSEIIFNETKKTLHFNDRNSNASFLALGNLSWTDSTNSFFDVHSKAGNYAMINNRQNTGKGSFPLANLGDTSTAFISKMLTTMRQTRVSEKRKTPLKNSSYLTLDRIMLESGINNLRIKRSE